MPSCCVLFTTDQTYLFPTLVSAIQARAHAGADKADVAIFAFGLERDAERDFAPLCAREGILFFTVGIQVLDGASAMLARLFLNRFVPSHYSQYIYLDGDVQIVASIDPLIDCQLESGTFMATNDPMTFMLGESGGDARSFAGNMAAIGLNEIQARSYFNTGVLRINRAGWDEIGRAAWGLCQKHAESFRFPDQDPLNIVGVDRHIPMSLAWNFPIFMCNARVEAQIKPRIYHFMSSPKPWQGAFAPWSRSSHLLYHDMVKRYPILARYYPAFPVAKRMRYFLQQRYKQSTEILTWGFSERRNRILRYEAYLEQQGERRTSPQLEAALVK